MNTQTTETTTAGCNAPKTRTREERYSTDGKWRYFPRVPNLIQYRSTGTYFARAKAEGKTIRLSLETDVFTTARVRLPDKLKQMRKSRPLLGTFGDARARYETAIANDHSLSQATRTYRDNCIKALLKTWPEVDSLQVRRIGIEACRKWAKKFTSKYDEQYFNNTLGSLRAIIEGAGVPREDNPAFKIKRLGVRPKDLNLPEREQFEAILRSIEKPGAPETNYRGPKSGECADLVRFLAYSGCRISEAKQVTWKDVDWDRKQIHVRNAKRSRASSAPQFRWVPMIPEMVELLKRLQRKHKELEDFLVEHSPKTAYRVCRVAECEESLSQACKKVGTARITHHDLRHLFATRCIEAGVDIPTVSRWLGHVDGGALAMKVYGHLRLEHSAAMAQRVTFRPVENLVQLQLPQAQEG